jgi:hypothetical protein
MARIDRDVTLGATCEVRSHAASCQRRHQRTFRTLLACSCILAASGCSWIFVKPSAPKHMQLRYFDCTSSKAAPILDTIGAGLGGASTVYVLSTDSAGVHAPPSHAAYIALGLGITALYTASAVYGYSHTSECAHAQDELQERLELEPRGPAGWPAPYPSRMQLQAPFAPTRCAYDTQCKGDRICERGQCVGPNAPSAPATTPPPLTPAPAEAAPAATPPAQPPPVHAQPPPVLEAPHSP